MIPTAKAGGLRVASLGEPPVFATFSDKGMLNQTTLDFGEAS